MQLDLMYIILPAAALTIGVLLGRFSKNVNEETYQNIFKRLRKKNQSLQMQVELVEAKLKSEKEDRFAERMDRIKKATNHNQLWEEIKKNNSLVAKHITNL